MFCISVSAFSVIVYLKVLQLMRLVVLEEEMCYVLVPSLGRGCSDWPVCAEGC